MIRSVILMVSLLVRCGGRCDPVVTNVGLGWGYNSVHVIMVSSDCYTTSTGSV